MAGRTRARKGKFVLYRPVVTINTDNLAMRTVYYELGAFVMIEVPGFPRTRIVTIIALRPQFLLVLVILLVTFHTRRRRITESLFLVTLLALDLDMRTGQREAGRRMIEFSILPARFNVTGFTIGPQLILVLVILAVA